MRICAGEGGGNIADPQLYATRDRCNAVIYFIGTGNIRAGLLRPQISGGEHPKEATYREAYSILPFDSDLTTTILICRQIKDFLEQ